MNEQDNGYWVNGLIPQSDGSKHMMFCMTHYGHPPSLWQRFVMRLQGWSYWPARPTRTPASLAFDAALKGKE